MWIPGPVYESLPYAYIVGGVLFLAGTAYAHPPPPMDSIYLAAGVISLLSGVLVFVRRRAARERKRSTD